jgi:hypothetical protein
MKVYRACAVPLFASLPDYKHLQKHLTVELIKPPKRLIGGKFHDVFFGPNLPRLNRPDTTPFRSFSEASLIVVLRRRIRVGQARSESFIRPLS